MATSSPASSSTRVIIPVNTASDGSESQWPDRGLRREDPSMYLSKLATKWATEQGIYREGMRYTLDRLPPGYSLFGKTRANDLNHVDRYLYGHPKYKFRSVEEFYPHFKSLMEHGNAAECTCIGCKGKRRSSINGLGTPSSQPRQNATSRAHPRIARAPKPDLLQGDSHGGLHIARADNKHSRNHRMLALDDEYDDEGTPDVYHDLIAKLKEKETLDEPIREPESFDWRINRKILPDFLRSLKTKPRFLPRIGELVLFTKIADPDKTLAFDAKSGFIKLWSVKDRTFGQFPEWQAGIVTQTPDEQPTIEDLLSDQAKEQQVNYSGYRIEPMPAVGDNDKSFSKRRAHVPLHLIRPFNLYKEVLKGIGYADWHPTIFHTLVAMASVSLVEKWHFKGQWPSATIFTKGVYLGAELLVVGDTIRLLPGKGAEPNAVTDVMQITAVKMKMVNLDLEENPEFEDLGAEPPRAFNTCIHVAGTAFTKDPRRAYGTASAPVDPEKLPSGIAGYGTWYAMHDPVKRWEIPFTQVLGRCYENEAAKLWFCEPNMDPSLPAVSAFSAVNQSQIPGTPARSGGLNKPSLSMGLKGMTKARSYSKEHDPRIDDKSGRGWHWGDTRVEQLDLHEVRGQEVNGNAERDMDAWDRAHRIREKGAGFKPKGFEAADGSESDAPQPFSSSLMAASAVGGEYPNEEDDEVEEMMDVDHDTGLSEQEGTMQGLRIHNEDALMKDVKTSNGRTTIVSLADGGMDSDDDEIIDLA